MSVIRYKVDSSGLLTEHPEGSLVAYSDLAASESKLDQLQKHREQAYEELAEISAENGTLRSRLGAYRTATIRLGSVGYCRICNGTWAAELAERHELDCPNKEPVVEKQSPIAGQHPYVNHRYAGNEWCDVCGLERSHERHV